MFAKALTRFVLGLVLLSLLLFLRPIQAAGQDTVSFEQGVWFAKNGGVDLRMDIAFPTTSRGGLPALIFISGSGWGHWWGDQFNRHQYSTDIKNAAAKGYVAATVDYRPTSIKEGGKSKYQYPAQLIDVRSAVRWLRANAAKYNIDPNRIGAIGWSSGGHLCLMLGLLGPQTKYPGETGDEAFSSTVQAVVSIAGPTELSRMYREATYPGISTALEDLLGGKPDRIAAKYREASPIEYVTRYASPALLIQGDQDTEVPPNQATLFSAKMREAGAPVRLLVIKNMSHRNLINNEEIYPFFDSVLKAKGK